MALQIDESISKERSNYIRFCYELGLVPLSKVLKKYDDYGIYGYSSDNMLVNDNDNDEYISW